MALPARARVRCGPHEQRERERGDELAHFYHKSQQLGSAHSIFSKTPGGAAAISSAKPCCWRRRGTSAIFGHLIGARHVRQRHQWLDPTGYRETRIGTDIAENIGVDCQQSTVRIECAAQMHTGPYHGGSTGLSLGGDVESGKTE